MYGFLMSFIPRWPLPPVTFWASCDILGHIAAEPQLPAGWVRATGQLHLGASGPQHTGGTEKTIQTRLLFTLVLWLVFPFSYPPLFDYKQYVLQAGCPQERSKGSLDLEATALRSAKMMSSVAFTGDTLMHHPELYEQIYSEKWILLCFVPYSVLSPLCSS